MLYNKLFNRKPKKEDVKVETEAVAEVKYYTVKEISEAFPSKKAYSGKRLASFCKRANMTYIQVVVGDRVCNAYPEDAWVTVYALGKLRGYSK